MHGPKDNFTIAVRLLSLSGTDGYRVKQQVPLVDIRIFGTVCASFLFGALFARHEVL